MNRKKRGREGIEKNYDERKNGGREKIKMRKEGRKERERIAKTENE